MAGSYGHLMGSDPEPRIEPSWSMIENMGDAYECVEQLLWLVLYFAATCTTHGTVGEAHTTITAAIDDVYYPMVRGERPADAALLTVRKVMED